MKTIPRIHISGGTFWPSNINYIKVNVKIKPFLFFTKWKCYQTYRHSSPPVYYHHCYLFEGLLKQLGDFVPTYKDKPNKPLLIENVANNCIKRQTGAENGSFEKVSRYWMKHWTSKQAHLCPCKVTIKRSSIFLLLPPKTLDRKSTRLNSSHSSVSRMPSSA